MKESEVVISIQSRKIFCGLVGVFLILFFANLTGLFFRFVLDHDYVYGLIPLFDFNLEYNAPTYFSSVILLISACLLSVIAVSTKKKHDDYFYYWIILSIIFMFLSIDETCGLHELLIKPLRNAFNLPGFLYYPWVILGFALVLFFAIFFLKFFFSLPKTTKYKFFLAAFLYIGGAIGIELIGGHYEYNYGRDNLMYNMIVMVEESFEMVGILLFINALLKYIATNLPQVSLSFKEF